MWGWTLWSEATFPSTTITTTTKKTYIITLSELTLHKTFLTKVHIVYLRASFSNNTRLCTMRLFFKQKCCRDKLRVCLCPSKCVFPPTRCVSSCVCTAGTSPPTGGSSSSCWLLSLSQFSSSCSDMWSLFHGAISDSRWALETQTHVCFSCLM